MNDPYHVYMDLDVVNNEYNSTSEPQLRFEENRNTPFLPCDNADYFCKLVRLNIQTGNTLPDLKPRIQAGQSDMKKTVYTMKLQMFQGAVYYDGNSYVEYSPEDETAPKPFPPSNTQDLSSDYYFV